MSLLRSAQLGDHLYRVGEAAGTMAKMASDAVPAYVLSGRLYASQSGFLMLSVPNAFARGLFDAMQAAGAEFPPGNDGKPYQAHISVMRPEEVAQIGGVDKIVERGHSFRWQLGPIKTADPAGWDEMSRVWFASVTSPELSALRRSYGLPSLPQRNGQELPFHCTVAVRRKKVLQDNDVTKASAVGIPDRKDYGDLTRLQLGQMADLLIQRHKAERAGEHLDVRVGTPETGLYSWATRKGLPAPGEKRMLFQQPVHSHQYGQFEGEIPEGYGKGTVAKEEEGRVLLTKVGPDSIHFSTAHKKHPERFVMMRSKKDPKHWLTINVTPTAPLPYQKIQYGKVPTEHVEQVLANIKPGSSVQAKIDGSAALVQLARSGVETYSYRQSRTTGRPIVHTERVHGGIPKIDLPRGLAGTILKGELYGQDQSGKSIHPAQLGGILNSTLENSLASQKAKGVKLKTMLYDVQQLGKKPVDLEETPYETRLAKLRSIAALLPRDTYHLPEEARTPESALQLWRNIGAGKDPSTTEGVIVHPPTGRPLKAKYTDEHDVHVRNIFPALGKYQGTHAGGFEYSHEPKGPVLGRVGTGFDDETRKRMHEDPKGWLGRVAKVRSQEKLPSGALRAPSFLSLHEDLTGV